MKTIGFVGLGHMGNPMARNLLSHGFTVKAYDISEEAVKTLSLSGAMPCHTLKEVSENSDVVITMLQNGQQVRDVCLEGDGLFINANSDTLFIDCSSIDPETSRDLHHHAQEMGFEMLDAPVSGGVTGAEAGTLTLMVGGEAPVVERAKPILEALGKRIVHVGAAGNGQVAKICNNMILGISMLAISEAFCLGEKLGLAPEKLFEVSSNSSGQCWSMTSYCPVPGLVTTAPSNNEFKPGFAAAMMLKDLLLSQAAADSVHAETSLGRLTTMLYQQFVSEGHGNLDFSGIIEMIRKA